MHRHHPELPSERPPGRLTLQGARPARDAAQRGHALGYPPAREALRRPLYLVAGPHLPWSTAPWPCSTRPCASSTSRPATSATPSEAAGSGALAWQDLLGFRRRGGLPGHAEMAGQDALPEVQHRPLRPRHARRRPARPWRSSGPAPSRCKVFAFEGEGGLTPGATHETQNSAWGLGLDNLYFVVDWNDYGIDDHAVSAASCTARPQDWFGAHGWRTSAPTGQRVGRR